MNLSAITPFDDNFEPEPTFENTINQIKYNHLKIIASSAKNLSDITSFDENFDQLSMNRIIEAEKFEPETTFENNINEIKDNNMKIIASAAMNLSDITSFEGKVDPLSMNNIFEASKFEPEPKFEKTINEIKANNQKSIISIEMNV